MWKNEESAQRQPLLGNEGEHGQKHEHDENFKGVKETGRKFNDIIFAFLFLIVVAAMIFVSVIGFSKGDPKRLIPSNEFVNKIENTSEYWFQDSVANLKRDWYIVASALVFSFILAIVWVQLMKWFTKVIIYMTLFLGIVAVIAIGFYFLSIGFQKHSSNLRILSYCLFGLGAILLVVVFFLRKKIALTAAMFTETCKGVNHNPGVIFVGILIFAIMAVFIAYWIAGFVYLYSIPASVTTKSVDPNLPPQFNTSLRNLMYFQVFAFFWVSAFLTAVFQVSVAGAIATWYFSRDVNGYGANTGSPVLKSLGRALTFHFGSLALGSLLLAIVQFLNFLLKLSKKTNQKNRLAVFIISCFQCCLGCVQRIIQFIDRFAYIYIAMHGDSFCGSAKNVFNLVSRNMFSAVVVDLLGEFVLFVGKLLGTAGSVALTVVTLQLTHRPLSPVTITVVAVGAYHIFSLFSQIVSVGVDTVMVCYLEDLERNKEGALYMDPELHRMLQDKASRNNGKSVNNTSK